MLKAAQEQTGECLDPVQATSSINGKVIDARTIVSSLVRSNAVRAQPVVVVLLSGGP